MSGRTARRHIGLETKLAAALLQLGHIPYEHAKLLTPRQCISLFAWDHCPVPVYDGGTDDYYNLVPRLISEHRLKTAKEDAPKIARTRRLSAAEEEFRAIILAKTTGEKPLVLKQKRKIPSRPFPKRPK